MNHNIASKQEQNQDDSSSGPERTAVDRRFAIKLGLAGAAYAALYGGTIAFLKLTDEERPAPYTCDDYTPPPLDSHTVYLANGSHVNSATYPRNMYAKEIWLQENCGPEAEDN